MDWVAAWAKKRQALRYALPRAEQIAAMYANPVTPEWRLAAHERKLATLNRVQIRLNRARAAKARAA